jgi:hypothetical protein
MRGCWVNCASVPKEVAELNLDLALMHPRPLGYERHKKSAAYRMPQRESDLKTKQRILSGPSIGV